MCTVSYVPLVKGYVLTSNRDENPERQTKLPEKIELKNGSIVYAPIDVLKGGTWIATDNNGRTACLLNGAFLKHKPRASYRKSRGQFVLDAFDADDFKGYLSSVFLKDIEPFTLLLVELNNVQKLIWDGTKKHISSHPPNTPYLWSSATLYNMGEHQKKEKYFLEELERNEKKLDLILQIHGKDVITPLILDHSNLQTVSTTQVIYDQKQTSLKYILKDKTNKTTNSLSLLCN